MNFRNPIFTALVVIVLSFSVGLRSQGLTDGIKVNLPYPVTVGDMVLDPGEYEIRRASMNQDQVLQIFNNDKLRYETAVITIPTEGEQTPEKSKVVLHHIGDNYYFDKIWMEGKTYGYEFVLPEKAQALQRDLVVDVAATYQSTPSSTPQQPALIDKSEANRSAEASRQAEVDRAAQDREQAAAADNAALEAQRAQDEERARQAQLDREREQADRDRIASLQQDSRSVQTPSSVQNDVQDREQLPATAANWVAYLIAGLVLLTLSALLRPSPRRQE